MINENCGIVALKNLKTDQVYLFYSEDIKNDCIKERFNLDFGMHPCKALQEDYTNTGLEVFRFDTVEYTKDPSRLEALKGTFDKIYK